MSRRLQWDGLRDEDRMSALYIEVYTVRGQGGESNLRTNYVPVEKNPNNSKCVVPTYSYIVSYTTIVFFFLFIFSQGIPKTYFVLDRMLSSTYTLDFSLQSNATNFTRGTPLPAHYFNLSANGCGTTRIKK